MCRSVPQMEATFTFTRTSVRPKPGILTSRISVPGLGSGFTTASMEGDMGTTLLLSARAQNSSFYHPLFSCRGRLSRTWTRWARFSLCGWRAVVLFRFPAGTAQRCPVAAAGVLSQENYLAGMLRGVGEFAVQCL